MLISAAVLLVLGLMVLAHERGIQPSRSYALVTFTVSGWLFCFTWMYAAAGEEVALWWAKAAYVFVPFIAPAIYHFTAVALEIYSRCRRWVWIGWTLGAAFAAVTLATDALISGLYHYWWGYYPRYGWLSGPYLTFFFGIMVANLRNYWLAYRESPRGARPRRIRIFMIAHGFAYVATIDYAAKFGLAVYPFGYLPVLGWLSLVAVALWRHQFLDITRSVAAEQIIKTMREALLVLDHDGIVRVVNRAACVLFSRPETEIVGRRGSALGATLCPPEAIEALLRTSIGRNYEAHVVAPGGDGSLLLDVSTSVIKDWTGEPTAIVCIARDITERKRAEEAIRASEERFRSFAQSANDAILSANRVGEIVYWNRGAKAVFGYDEEEVLGRPLTMLMPERYHDSHRAGIERMRAGGEGRVIGTTVELHGVRKDGKEFPLELSLASWRAGEETFYSGIIRDITARKQLEEQLRQSQKMEAVGSLAGGVAHDFNNLLTVIKGYCHLALKRAETTGLLRRDLEQIKGAGERAAALTQQMLAFSRRQVAKLEMLNLSRVVGAMGEMLKRLIGEDMNLVLRLEPLQTMVRADRGQIEQVIMNLAVNSRDAMPQGGQLTIETIHVDVGRGERGRYGNLEPGAYVALCVTDTGCGMDEATQARIFDPFFTTKEPGKGTGLGLSTVYGIVKQSKGTVVVESEPGRGTIFRIYFPRIEPETVERLPEPAPVVVTGDGSKTILLVEDEDMVRALLQQVLREHGYEVLEARNGSEALRLFDQRRGPIDMLLADVVMPGLNGRQLAERLSLAWPGMKVLFISGYLDDMVTLKGVMESGTPFLPKPLDPEVLLEKVRQVLQSPDKPHA